jgi:hypothetical protein
MIVTIFFQNEPVAITLECEHKSYEPSGHNSYHSLSCAPTENLYQHTESCNAPQNPFNLVITLHTHLLMIRADKGDNGTRSWPKIMYTFQKDCDLQSNLPMQFISYSCNHYIVTSPYLN